MLHTQHCPGETLMVLQMNPWEQGVRDLPQLQQQRLLLHRGCWVISGPACREVSRAI